MIRISDETELRAAFRTIDQDELKIPSEFRFPIVLTDYLSWQEPSGHRLFLIFQDPQRKTARGLVLRRSSSAANTVPQMCEWCHSVRSGSAVKLLTAKVNSRKSLGVHLCADLSCKEKVLGPPGVNDLREPYSRYEKLFRVILNMADFADCCLGIERTRQQIRSPRSQLDS